ASVFVNKNAKIDFSAGSVSGNGGLLRIDAFDQLGFYGILNGRAPPGYTPGKAILDPLLSEISGQFSSNTVIYSPNDILIVGDISVTTGEYYDIYFAILADHNSETVGDWHDGIGAIINTGDYVIYFSENTEYSSLTLRAGSGIGSLEHFIQTSNAGHVSAAINPNGDGDIFFEELGSYGLAVSDVRSPGLVVINCSGPVWGESEGADVVADELYITAEGGIGSSYDPFEVNVRNFAAENVDFGDIYISSPNDLTVLAISNRVSQGEDGQVNIDCGGTLSIRYGIYASFDVWLWAEENIILSTFADIVAPGSYVTLYALGYITRRNMEVLDYGMRAYWNFDQEPYYYYFYAQDVSGNGYSAYASGNPGIVPGPDGFGQALYFNGVNDYINIGRDFYFGTGAFTLICWYQGEQSRNNVGLMGVSPYPYTSGYAMETQYGALQSWVNNDMDASPVTVNDNQWYRLAMVREGSEGSMYLFQENDLNPDTDELQYGSTYGTSPDPVDTYGSFFIGGWGHMYRLAQGALDDVRVYGTALSGLEIYAQTILAPGTGRISAYNVELYANSGVDMGLGTVETMHVSNNTGAIVIDSLSDMTIDEDTFYVGDSQTITDGDITLITAGNIYVNEDIYTIGDYDLTLTADGNIVLADQINVYSDSAYGDQPAVSTALSGDVSLTAGGDIVLGYSAGVYSYVYADADEGDAFARSGNVRFFAGNNITMARGHVYSDASAYGYGSCTAYSGDVVLEAGNNLTETGFFELIYSSARADAYENPDSSAFASSGLVSLYAGNSLTIDGTEGAGYPYYGADVYSSGYATGGFSAVAYSSSVSLATGDGDITLYWLEVRSDAYAQTYTAETPGTTSSAYARGEYYDYYTGEWVYTAVSIDAGGSILMNDNTSIYGAASAQGDASYATARSGDVTLNAGFDISLASHVYSDAMATAENLAEAISGKVDLISYDGPITVPNTALVWSNASANTIYDDSEAFAYSDDVTVQCLNGPVSIAIGVYSTSEAYGDADISPRLLEAVTGNVLVYAYGDLSLPGGYAYTSATTSSDNALSLSLTSGDVSLYGANISLTDGRVYSGQNDNDEEWTAVDEVDIIAGDVLLSSPGNIVVSGYAQITSSARAYCTSMEASEDTVSAVAGDIELSAGGDITLDLALVDLIPIESFGSYSFYESEMYYASGTVSLLADADWSGSGALSHTAYGVNLGGANFNFSGAQSFDFYAGDGIDVYSEGFLSNLDLNIPGWEYPGISLASTLETGSVAADIYYYEGYDAVPYIRLYSAGDVIVDSDLIAVDIVLRADYDPNDPQGIGNGTGDLVINGIPYGDVAVFYRDPYILADSHVIQTAGAIQIIGDSIMCGDNEFGLALGPVSGELLGALTVKSTSGSVTVTESEEGGEYLARTGDAAIDIWASADIILDAPVSVGAGGLSLISDTGSIIAGAEDMTHITAGSDVYLQAGNEYISEGTSVIGTLDAPLRIMVDGGSVTMRVYGQIVDEELNEAVSGNLIGVVNGSEESDAVQVLNDAPGPVYFNNAPAPEPEPEPDETDDDDEQDDDTQPGPIVPSAPAPEAPDAPLGSIISYEPSAVDPAALETMQFSSPVGTVFAYHPITRADMGAVEPLSVGAGSYELLDGEIRLFGNEGLLQFFQEFDEKYKQL
ncbi:MAG TPA: hypothetical protein PKL03_06965, partial [Candidatus Omnitrophota bacterium]|nr:hypothetical protein [Candidatus Omnitrophota bacterium]